MLSCHTGFDEFSARSRSRIRHARSDRNGATTVEDGSITGSSLMPAAGYALLRASSREELARVTKQFLECAGDGTCEIIQLMDDMPQQT